VKNETLAATKDSSAGVADAKVPGTAQASVDAVVGEFVAASMTQHVWVNWERKTGSDVELCDDLMNTVMREWRAALRGKDKCR
jgi:hypothetical protein